MTARPLSSGRGAGTVLALRALGLGDALTGVPALRGLRRAFPRHRLVLAAPPRIGSWLGELGLIDETLAVDSLAARPPVPGLPARAELIAVNLHGRGPQSHRLLRELRPNRLIAFQHEDAGPVEGPAWRPDEHEVDRWCRLVGTVGGRCGRADLRLGAPPPDGSRPYLVVHPGAAAAGRRWPVERWRAVVQNLLGTGADVVLTGGPDERSLCARLGAGWPQVRDTSGRLGLSELARLVAGARLLLCADTGVAHLATAFGTPSVVLFGPTPPALWGPAIDQDRHLVLWPAQTGERPGDPHRDGLDPTLARITVDQVLAAVSRFSPLLPAASCPEST